MMLQSEFLSSLLSTTSFHFDCETVSYRHCVFQAYDALTCEILFVQLLEPNAEHPSLSLSSREISEVVVRTYIYCCCSGSVTDTRLHTTYGEYRCLSKLSLLLLCCGIDVRRGMIQSSASSIVCNFCVGVQLLRRCREDS